MNMFETVIFFIIFILLVFSQFFQIHVRELIYFDVTTDISKYSQNIVSHRVYIILA